jgi:hypothetical protein
VSGWGSGGSWGSGPSQGSSGDSWGQPQPTPHPPSGWGSPADQTVTPPPPSPGGGWGGGGAGPSAPGAVTSAPLLWLLLALAVVAISTALWFVSDDVPIGVVGWALAGPGAIGLLAVFLLADSQRRAGAWYTPSAVAPPLRVLVLVWAFAAVGLHAYHVADVISRSGS